MGLFEWYLVFTAIFCGLYFILMTTYIIQWLKMPLFIPPNEGLKSNITIVIPARNEEQNIKHCLSDIRKQNFPLGKIEVIVVDDYSKDDTATLASSLIKTYGLNGKVLKMGAINHELPFKKGAITEAIKIASHDLIITTDADCRMGPEWLSAFVAYYDRYTPKMIAGPIGYLKGNGLISQLQSLECAGLMLATGGGFNGQFPIMANGANLCYEKQAFQKVAGYLNNEDTASGDDLFLLMKFKKQFKGNLHFIKSPEAMVYTQPLNSFMSFWMQRKRWASKSRQCKDLHFLIIGSIVLGANLILLFGLPISILVPSIFSSLFIFIFGSKLIVDFCFLFFATKFQNNKNLMVIFPIGAILNTLSVSIFGLTSWFGKYNWKGRSH